MCQKKRWFSKSLCLGATELWGVGSRQLQEVGHSLVSPMSSFSYQFSKYFYSTW